MRRFVATLAVVGALLAVSVTPALAITKTYVKDFEHPFVGLIAFYNAAGQFQHRCTGELLAPTVVLTAGHCTDNGAGGVEDNARIWFQQDAGTRFDGVEDLVTGYPNRCAAGTLGVLCAEGTVMYNYGFNNFAGFPNIHDVGIVILDQAVEMDEYASLAGDGTLNGLKTNRGTQDVTFRVSGYGISHSAHKRTVFVSFRERLMATETLTNLNNQWTNGFNLQLNGNGDDRGGTCAGDSGGPVFYPSNSNQVVAVTSFGKTFDCRGDGFYYRTDRQAVIDWILDHAGADAGDIVVN